MEDLAYIDEQIRPLAVPIETVIPDPNNARLHPDANLEGIIGSLRQFGQVKPIVVRKETMVICCGNGTWAALRRMGKSHVAANIREMSLEEATALAIADNHTSDLSDWNRDVLAGQLDALPSFDDPFMRGMMETLKQNLEQPETKFKELQVKAPPKMAWVLIGIPLTRFGEINQDIERIATIPDAIVEMTSNDDTGNQDG